MSDIRAARAFFIDHSNHLRRLGMHALANDVDNHIILLNRAKPARKMGARSREVTPGLKSLALHLLESTTMHNAEIAVHLGVNPGRISEIANGYR